MSENNLPNEGMESEEVENVVEEVVEDAYGATEEATEEALEEIAASKTSKYKTSAIIAWILVAVLAVVDVWYFMTNIYNKYNNMGYLDVDGYTIGEIVSSFGMSFDEFKEMYGLPKDMRKDTYSNAAQSLITVGKMCELNRTDLETLKEEYKFGDEITEESTWGEALESMTVANYVGEERFEEFKAHYQLGDEVTAETKWGEIRKEVEKKQVAERLAKEQPSEDDEEETPVEEPSADTEAETPSDEEAPAAE